MNIKGDSKPLSHLSLLHYYLIKTIDKFRFVGLFAHAIVGNGYGRSALQE